jgi:hypothetical protein
MSPDQISMLDELLSYDGGRLTGWEIDFLESLDRRRDDERALTEPGELVHVSPAQ